MTPAGPRLRAHAVRLGAAAAVLSLVVSAAGIALRSRTPTPTARRAEPAAFLEIQSARGASFVPALQGKRPLFILALGSDARPGQDPTRQRSDSIHIIGVDLVHHRATVLGFPRDSYVPIPGFGTDKITSAMADGGPQLTVRTIENLTGIPIDFWMLATFPTMASMVDGIGGVDVRVSQPMHDPFSGAFFGPGVHHMNGGQALAFSRDRHDFAMGDITRSYNQGTVLLAALRKLHTVFQKDPGSILSWVALGWRNLRTNLSLPTLLTLALTATGIPSANVNNVEVPASTGMVGAASVVYIGSGAQRLYAEMRATGVIQR